MQKEQGGDRRPRVDEPLPSEDAVPTAAESWRQHVRIHEVLERIREGRRLRRTARLDPVRK